ncbi:MAG: uracil-DNA glycosylase, partial [Thermoguttaceae bacterium]|nr:uracil-DNA glycosylase [Thermoguttaceae bacterium]
DPDTQAKIATALALSDQNEERLLALARVVQGCTRCPILAPRRTNTGFGSGNPNAELVFVGEGPGADEDAQGLPFVGRSGQLLTDIIEKGMRISRSEVYICNIVRCRPPENRRPTDEEAAFCRPFLDATLEVIRPKSLCLLGATAAQSLLGTTESIGKLRGRVHEYRGARVVCTYHPSYLLRNPAAKRQTWEDIKLLLQIMGREVSQ